MNRFIQRLRIWWLVVTDTIALRYTNRQLRAVIETQRLQIGLLESNLRLAIERLDIVKLEALQAEQVITGVQHHLRDKPKDAARIVHRMLSAR